MEAVNFHRKTNKKALEGTYAGGTFRVSIEMDEDYPTRPPKALFLTPIQHPNVLPEGRICHNVLGRTSVLTFLADNR